MPHVKPLYPVVLLAAILHALPVWSAQESGAAPDNTFGQMEDLHARNLVLQAELQGAELSRSLSETRNPAGIPSTGSAAEPGRPTSLRDQVLTITGRGNQLQASVRLRDGRTVTLRKGSTLPGTALKVASLSREGVSLSDGTLITF